MCANIPFDTSPKTAFDADKHNYVRVSACQKEEREEDTEERRERDVQNEQECRVE